MNSRQLLQVVSRGLSTSARRAADEVHPGYAKLRAKQELFQQPNGLPVHLKGGAFDGILYRFTLGLCAIGVANTVYLAYTLVFPKK